MARRALATAAHNNCASVNVEFFLYGLHSLFKGDFRITGEMCFWCTVKIIKLYPTNILYPSVLKFKLSPELNEYI